MKESEKTCGSILAGAAQWVQQRMMIQPAGDPTMHIIQQVLQVLPLALIVVAARYPAGLVLYWVISTLYGIALQLLVSGRGQLFTSPFRLATVTAGEVAASAVALDRQEMQNSTERGRGSGQPRARRSKRRSSRRRGRARL